jgi:hypothetical protein
MDGWLEHLRDDDLALLRRATGRRVGPGQVEALLADPAAYEAVFDPRGDPLLHASPFLVLPLPCTGPRPSWRRPPSSPSGFESQPGPTPASTGWDNGCNYEPGNVHWATRAEQN